MCNNSTILRDNKNLFFLHRMKSLFWNFTLPLGVEEVLEDKVALASSTTPLSLHLTTCWSGQWQQVHFKDRWKLTRPNMKINIFYICRQESTLSSQHYRKGTSNLWAHCCFNSRKESVSQLFLTFLNGLIPYMVYWNRQHFPTTLHPDCKKIRVL